MLFTQGLHRAQWLPCSFPPHPLCPFRWGGGWERLPWLPRHGPWGGGPVLFVLRGLRLRPLSAAPQRMGVGVDRCPLLLRGPRPPRGHEATETGLAYAPVSRAHGHNHIVQAPPGGGGVNALPFI